jgi:cyanate permease
VIDNVLVACGGVGGFFALCCLLHSDGTSRWWWLAVLLGHCFIVGTGLGHMWGNAPSIAAACLAGIATGAFPLIWAGAPRRSMTPERASQVVIDLDDDSFNNLCAASIERMRRSTPGP